MAATGPAPHAGVRVRQFMLSRPIGRYVAGLAAMCAMLLVALCVGQYAITGWSHRLALASGFAVLLAVATAVVPFLPWRPQQSAMPLSPGRAAWTAALALSMAVALVGLTMVALLALYPPPLEHSAFKAWPYLDKRWLIVLYLLCVGLAYLPAGLRRLLSEGAVVADDPLAPSSASLGHLLAAVGAGIVLAVLCIVPAFPASLVRYVDLHEQVHLGGFQRIAHGALPYIDARTQYGPGHQILSYAMMRSTGFTLLGFRVSQAWLNLLTVALLFALWLHAYGARIGLCVIAASLAVSPVLVATFWGWGLVLRWIAPVLVGALLPLVLWRQTGDRARAATVIALGVGCGVLAWLAQENLSGAVITAGLVLAAAVARGAIDLRTALLLGALFVAAEIATLLALMIGTFGLAHLREALSFFFLSTGLVFQGMTDTSWSEPYSTWRRAYFFTPLLVIAIPLVTLHFRRRPETAEGELRIGQILGMAAAAAPLTMLSMFRADGPHFIGTSTALVPLLILSVAYLPGKFELRLDRRNAARLALMALFVLVYFNPRGNVWTRTHNLRTFSDPRLIGNIPQTIAGLRLLAGGPAVSEAGRDIPDAVVRRLGFAPTPNALCCYNRDWTNAEFTAMLARLHTIVAGRTVFIDVKPPLESSGMYFLADLVPASPYVSHIMSVWTDDDNRDARAALARDPPACVISDRPDPVISLPLIRSFRTRTVTRLARPVPLWVACTGSSISWPADPTRPAVAPA